jgi:hypothetical protein
VILEFWARHGEHLRLLAVSLPSVQDSDIGLHIPHLTASRGTASSLAQKKFEAKFGRSRSNYNGHGGRRGALSSAGDVHRYKLTRLCQLSRYSDGLQSRMRGVRFPEGVRDYLLHSVQTDSEIQRPGREAANSPPSYVEVMNNRAIHPLPHFFFHICFRY